MTGSAEAAAELQQRILADLVGIQNDLKHFGEQLDLRFDRIEAELARKRRVMIEMRGFLREASTCARERRQASTSSKMGR